MRVNKSVRLSDLLMSLSLLFECECAHCAK